MMDEIDCFSAMHYSLHSFMKKGTFTDIIFRIGESKVKAHKAVLASCSSVFQTMFETSVDAQSSEVVMTDVEEELFSAYLDYLYLRDVKIVERHSQGMLMLADKYDIEPLAALCDSFIKSSLTPENAVDTLFVAILYRRESLKLQVNLYIKNHLDEVSTHPSWEKLDSTRSEHFDAMNGIFQSCLKNNDENRSNQEMNEKTWSANREPWVGYWVSLIPRDGDTNTVCRAKPSSGPNNTLCIDVELENKHNEGVNCTVVITMSRNSVTTKQTKSFLYWVPNAISKAELLVDTLYYPFEVTVAVKKTEPIYQHPYLKMVKEQTIRFSDVVVVVENVKFPVHKLVLAGRSTFFSELFEKNQNEYRLDGISERTFKILLAYIYTSHNPEADQVDLALLKGAETFRLNELISYCLSALQKNITCDNAVEMCAKAEKLQLNKFSSLVMDFMVKEPKSVVNSLKWPTIRNHPRVMKELLYKINRK